MEKAPDTAKYRSALSIRELGSHVVDRHQACRLVHPVPGFAAQSTGLTAFLTCLSLSLRGVSQQGRGSAHARSHRRTGKPDCLRRGIGWFRCARSRGPLRRFPVRCHREVAAWGDPAAHRSRRLFRSRTQRLRALPAEDTHRQGGGCPALLLAMSWARAGCTPIELETSAACDPVHIPPALESARSEPSMPHWVVDKTMSEVAGQALSSAGGSRRARGMRSCVHEDLFDLRQSARLWRFRGQRHSRATAGAESPPVSSVLFTTSIAGWTSGVVVTAFRKFRQVANTPDNEVEALFQLAGHRTTGANADDRSKAGRSGHQQVGD